MPSTIPEDESMVDAQPLEDQEVDAEQQQDVEYYEEEEEEEEEEEDQVEEILANDHQRITILPGAVETAASFQFEAEDHTLGNALRYMIMKNPDVEFCGYTMPHPSEAKLNLRIQTYDSTDVFTALEKGLDDLMDLCDVVTEKFVISRENFEASKMQH
ncbi:DNA-directed RNA polymerase I and III subunit RPAC2 [Nannizzia gypsea CBS 118893]|uniref:DNA-directed RNA polymerases I and III subunit RPAC2 n=1 Tax=Arthroderma gypseum (strain ATCC MYA-4604 / CBS 118893) TaxID=535722 RepID=E4UZG6_ARTGP|nr:DNA-directed RNA polymerase I and III subunit RPAC2 [Nannizzia gypsea CBS 118893]EFR03496.1 DNA-directed RNA polymerase I and III subunit RPAC2 [Nannizzia gypsea CBS 118893]